jgi:DNA-binding GntR family transcriptional regulator
MADMDFSTKTGAAQRVYRGIMADLEAGLMVPGQRLIETDLAERFAVGRNAVREAMQRLNARGVIDLSRHRSPAVRRLDISETMEVLDVARAMTGLVLRTAAAQCDRVRHDAAFDAAQALLEQAVEADEAGAFSRARRAFYRLLLDIGGNRELQRLFPAIGMHIIYAQYQTRRLRDIRLTDYCAMIAAVRTGDPAAAEAAAHIHVDRVRATLLSLPNPGLHMV